MSINKRHDHGDQQNRIEGVGDLDEIDSHYSADIITEEMNFQAEGPPGGATGRDFTIDRLFSMFVMENRRRDQFMENIIKRLFPVSQTNSNRTSSGESSSISNNHTYAIMPELLKNIPNFHGDLTKAKRFLESLNSAQILYSLPDNNMLETARTRMIDGAKFWYQTKSKEISTWQDFVQQFKKTFLNKESSTVKWKKMMEITQRR
ncbi:hypothetical protein JTB14_013413 [Gonioctena quinquepunctata]|nr:hypothetical protein JTB14_013413 [Gonioctena quinquepunctata]